MGDFLTGKCKEGAGGETGGGESHSGVCGRRKEEKNW